MKQKDAKEAILRIWDDLGNPSSKADATCFYFYLMENHPEVLDFRTPGSDQREAVKSWLLGSGRLGR